MDVGIWVAVGIGVGVDTNDCTPAIRRGISAATVDNPTPDKTSLTPSVVGAMLGAGIGDGVAVGAGDCDDIGVVKGPAAKAASESIVSMSIGTSVIVGASVYVGLGLGVGQGVLAARLSAMIRLTSASAMAW